MKKFEIIATIGPATEKRIEEMISAGATGFRINSSHLTLQELSKYLMELEKVFQQVGDAMPVWLDLQGTKFRLGKLQQPRQISNGEKIVLSQEYHEQENIIPLPHPSVFESVAVGDRIFIDDGKIEIIVEGHRGKQLSAVVIKGGQLTSFKGVTVQNKLPEFRQISSRDETIVKETRSLKFLGYAISYIKNHQEIQLFRDLVGGKPLTAKIEREDAMPNLIEISNVANALWLCRGDLGTNTNVFDLHRHEKHFAKIMSLSGKPYLIAGEVLQHMTQNPYPTRSEIAHLGMLYELGFSGVVLSDETATGKYPLETIKFCRQFSEYLPS